MTSVDARQRFTTTRPCPICGGHQYGRRGTAAHCYGYLSSDGQWANCTRQEYAGNLAQRTDNTFGHKLAGPCPCGTEHGPAPIERPLRLRRRNSVPSQKNGLVTHEVVYDYTDACGTLLFQALRYQDPKGFAQRRPRRADEPPKSGDSSQWVYDLQQVPRPLPLYRLPAVLAAPADMPIYIVEGEKDVECLVRLGLVATTTAMGAGKSRLTDLIPLADRTVVILPDNDEPGRRHADQIATTLAALRCIVKVVELPDLPEKGDVSDWFAAGATVEQLHTLVDTCPIFSVSRFFYREKPRNRENQENQEIFTSMQMPHFRLTSVADLIEEPVEEVGYVVQDLLPTGGVSLCAAKPKVGKSTLGRNIAVAVARGTPCLGRATVQGQVLYFALEEKRAEVAAHFRRMGVVADPIYIHTGSAPEAALSDLAFLLLNEYSAARLVVIDPLFKLVRIRDASDYAEVSRALEPLIELARQTGAHIMALHHTGKAERAGGDAVLGSTAIFGGVDALLLMKRLDRYRTIESIQRYGVDLPETIINLDAATGIISADGDVATRLHEHAQQKIREVLGSESLTEPEIRDRVGGNQSTTSKALRELVVAGTIVRTGSGRKGDPYSYILGDRATDNLTEFSVSRFTHREKPRNRENQENRETGQRDAGPGDGQTVTGLGNGYPQSRLLPAVIPDEETGGLGNVAV